MIRTSTQPISRNQKHIVFRNSGNEKFGPAQLLLLVFFSLGFATFSNQANAQTCCPEFYISDAVEICPIEGACKDEDPVGQSDLRLIACKNTAHTYTVYPNDPGFTYTWTVSGGTAVNTVANPNTIVWGTGSSGTIKVVISNLAFGGTCIDSITSNVCLVDGPEADFYASQDTVCENTLVQFFNTSLGGASYSWDFGDGNYSTDPNPQHAYTTAGTYTVKLTAQDMGQGQFVFSQEPPLEDFVPCGCIDTITKTIVVLPGSGPEIETDCCFGTVCPGDTTSFCTPNVCGTYNWIVSGGSIVSGTGTNCIDVVWDASYTVPTTVSLVTPGCASTTCNDTTTLQVPVLYPVLPVSGPTVLCQGASGSFTLPTLPGTYYTWSVSGGGYLFNMKDRNTPTVNITFYDASVYTIKCDYHNPLAGCSGSSTFTVDVKPVFEFVSGEETVCEGDTKSYFVNGNASWTVSPAGASIAPSGSFATINWNTPGTYFITATPTTPSSWCNTNAVKIVEVVPLPVLNSILGMDSVCPGQNHIYSISSDNDDNPFVWSISGGTGTIHSEMGANSDSVIVSWSGAGPWQLSVHQENEIAPGVICQSLTEILDIYPFAPPSISGPGVVCVDAIESYPSGLSGSVEDIVWSISPSNRGTITSGQGTGSVTVKWHGTPTTATLSVSSCAGSDIISVNIVNPPTIPVIGVNGPTNYCLPDLPNNLTLSIPSGYAAYQWYHNGLISGATSNTYNIPNGTFTGAGAYVFEVEVSNGQCSVTNNIVILIGDCPGGGSPPLPFDCTIDFSMNPDPACENEPVTFTAIPPIPGFTYAWDFGDGSTSFESPTEHAYAGTGTYTVKLTATLGTVCVVDTTKTITVNPVPSCTISATDTIFCPGSFETLTACGGMSSYQWFKDGSPLTGSSNSTLNVYEPGDYHVMVTNSFGCSTSSNKIYMYLHQLPKADIDGPGIACALPGGTAGFLLETKFDADYTYSWSSIPAGATFSPPTSYSPYVSFTAPTTLPAIFEFVVTVTDVNTGCMNNDTICVPVYEQPQVTLPQLYICEGTPVTLTPSLIPNDPARYTYQWNNGSTDPVIIAQKPGYYSLIVTDKVSGCSAFADAGLIFPKPDLSLFPTGCADICPPDSVELYLPLPLNSPQWPYNDYPSAYPSITWYDNGVPAGSGELFTYPATNTGYHEITAIVQNHYGCIDTAGVYCITDDVCCDIVLDYFRATDATCPDSFDGSISILLSNTSIGGPFTITQIFPSPVQTWTITPGVPFNLSGLPPGTYAFQIVSADGTCELTIDLNISYLQEACCFAATDSSFIHITSPITYTSDMVWDNKYYIADGVMVTVDGAMLDVTNVDVVFGECAGIEFINGGYFRANNSVLRPCEIDGSWKGLRFDSPGEFDNIINESTFKNAEVALYFKGGSDGVISNNLFSNCNFGVRVENHSSFDHPISGNRFVTEGFFPDFTCDSAYAFVSNFSSYGIYTASSNFHKQVSHNEFINANGTDYPSTYGVYQYRSGGIFSENTCSDLGTAFYFYSQQYYTSIENNEIEVNLSTLGNFTSIFISGCQGPVVEVMYNEIKNNFSQFPSFSAIYATSSTNLNIDGNTIEGFNYGIIDVSSVNHQISNNHITNCATYGIYVYELANSQGLITCNTIKMRNFNSSIGFVGYNMPAQSEVSSNCIHDSYNSMSFFSWPWGGNTPTLPLIRNNFLYNYNYAGINVQGYSGNIGTAADPGLNTLWSNNNSAIDINSSSTINVADNFGMFNISFPQVQITSNNPFHSTASCGHQIFNMPSQGNLNVDYRCDNFDVLMSTISGSGGIYALQPDYLETLKSSSDPLNDASLLLHAIADPGQAIFDEIIDLGVLSENEEALLGYYYHYKKAEYEPASQYLNQMVAPDKDEMDFIQLANIDLDLKSSTHQAPVDEYIAVLDMMIQNNSSHTNFAITLLNDIGGYYDYQLTEPLKSTVTGTPNIKRVEGNSSYLSIYPNPASEIATIQLISGVSGNTKIDIWDTKGNLVTNYDLNVIAGTIELDLRHLENGLYFVTLSNSETGMVQKGRLIKMDNK